MEKEKPQQRRALRAWWMVSDDGPQWWVQGDDAPTWWLDDASDDDGDDDDDDDDDADNEGDGDDDHDEIHHHIPTPAVFVSSALELTGMPNLASTTDERQRDVDEDEEEEKKEKEEEEEDDDEEEEDEKTIKVAWTKTYLTHVIFYHGTMSTSGVLRGSYSTDFSLGDSFEMTRTLEIRDHQSA